MSSLISSLRGERQNGVCAELVQLKNQLQGTGRNEVCSVELEVMILFLE